MLETSPIKVPLVVTTSWLKEQGLGSRRTIYRRIADRKFPLPDTKIGNRVAWKRSTVIEHLEREGLA